MGLSCKLLSRNCILNFFSPVLEVILLFGSLKLDMISYAFICDLLEGNQVKYPWNVPALFSKSHPLNFFWCMSYEFHWPPKEIMEMWKFCGLFERGYELRSKNFLRIDKTIGFFHIKSHMCRR